MASTTNGGTNNGDAVTTADPVPLRELLAGYDRQVDGIRKEVLATTTGTERVQLLNKLRRAISVHDSVLQAALCPILDELPGGSAVAEQLRDGCRERTGLLEEFRKHTDGIAAHNVYAASGTEIERILEGLDRSFQHHEYEETDAVAAVLEASKYSTDPDVVGARMALAASRAPTRQGSGLLRKVRLPKRVLRYADKYHDWVDTHHEWTR